MKKVLMIAYHFPPMVSVGVLRALKFAKYLLQFGWKPIILTIKHPGPLTYKLDHQFTRDKLKGVKVYRSWGFPLAWAAKGLRRLGANAKWFIVPDDAVGWFLHSVFVGKKIIEKEKIDAIYATSPSPTALLIATFLKRMCNKPLIVDFRDPWIDNTYVSYPSKIHYNLEKRMEEWVLKEADAVVLVAEKDKKRLMGIFPFLKGSDISVIPNGYDPEDFVEAKPHKFSTFTILHAGSIYGNKLREFELFLRAANCLIQEKRVSADDFQLILMGYLASAARRIINELNLPNVHYLGVKTYNETISLMMGADVLLLIPGFGDNITTKVYEYLAAGKFILNLANSNDQVSRLIHKMKAGETAEPNMHSIQETLYKVLKHKDIKVKVNSEKLNKFSRDNLTKELALILDSVYSKFI